MKNLYLFPLLLTLLCSCTTNEEALKPTEKVLEKTPSKLAQVNPDFMIERKQQLHACAKGFDHQTLNASLELGTTYMLNNQKPEGNFNYAYDWQTEVLDTADNQVRQAGALWGLSLIYNDNPSLKVEKALLKAMAFFREHSQLDQKGRRYIIYPGDARGSIGTVALTALAYVDYLRTKALEVNRDKKTLALAKELDEYLAFIVHAQQKDQRWHARYTHEEGKPIGRASPYFDGESLLALTKAAKYLGYTQYIPIIMKSAQAGYRLNVTEALKLDPDSKTTKGYYQWSSMAFYEMATAGWLGAKPFGQYVIDLADWMIDVHETLRRTRNTAYAYEGIIHAYQLAMLNNNKEKADKFACVIAKGMRKLTSWQVGSPIANKHVRDQALENPLALGGVQNHRKESYLRVDVAQHQMHAALLARRYVYLEDAATP
ncbi:MAG: hypothetical protein QGI45_15845 [Myxococcota bacterium]|nr:hypothetical protein [Myxococcota bacterium]